MSRLLFTNLLIDQIWDKDSILSRAFPEQDKAFVKITRLGENLGVYGFDSESQGLTNCILGIQPDFFWLQHFTPLQALQGLNYIVLNSAPTSEDEWLSEFKKIKPAIKYDSALFSGISSLELRLSEMIDLKLENKNFDFKVYNEKSFLYHFCKRENILFPQSELISGKEISATSEDEALNFIFKSPLSSGGSGLFNYSQIKILLAWIERNEMNQAWEDSHWLKQRRYKRIKDLSTFGNTLSHHSKTVQVSYDNKNLSSEHLFHVGLEASMQNTLSSVFELLRSFLLEKGYGGPFGFDSFLSEDGSFFPLIDLNVRLTKTHLLAEALKLWEPQFAYCSIVRIRFRNKAHQSFQEFWSKFSEICNLNDQGIGLTIQVLPIEVSSWNFERAESTWILSGKNSELVKEVKSILQKKLDELSKEGGP
jgi:hypothetical protein